MAFANEKDRALPELCRFVLQKGVLHDEAFLEALKRKVCVLWTDGGAICS